MTDYFSKFQQPHTVRRTPQTKYTANATNKGRRTGYADFMGQGRRSGKGYQGQLQRPETCKEHSFHSSKNSGKKGLCWA